ncbi:MAG: SAM-dependent methyltransferase, partial [Hungatella hathewayi]
VEEMLRICREVRIFPLVNLDAEKTELTQQVIRYFQNQYEVQIKPVGYEFQKGADQMLVIRKHDVKE